MMYLMGNFFYTISTLFRKYVSLFFFWKFCYNLSALQNISQALLHAVSSFKNPQDLATFMVHFHSLLSIEKKKKKTMDDPPIT